VHGNVEIYYQQIIFTAILIFSSLSAFTTKSKNDHYKSRMYSGPYWDNSITGITGIMIMRNTFSPCRHIVNCHMARNSWEMKLVVSACVSNCSDIYTTKLQNQISFFYLCNVFWITKQCVRKGRLLIWFVFFFVPNRLGETLEKLPVTNVFIHKMTHIQANTWNKCYRQFKWFHLYWTINHPWWYIFPTQI
jgi:hypothetical protein